MASLLVNVDIADVRAGIAFYTSAFGLTVGRRLGPSIVELLGLDAPIYLIEKPAGSTVAPGAGPRDYGRHWTPVHLDVVVDDLDAAVQRVERAGARREREVGSHVWGRIAYFADPFGNGFCLVEFSERGYDAIADPETR